MNILLLLLAIDSTTIAHVAVAPRESLTVHITIAASRREDSTNVPVVFLPGLLGGAFGFRKLTPLLAAFGQSTFAIEPLGVGSSSHPDGGDYSLDAQADRVNAVLDTLGVSNAVIAGSNFGASVALRLAYRHPERVAAVVLIDGGPVDRSSTGGASLALRLAPVLKLFGARGMARRHIADALRKYSADPSWVTDEVVDAYARPIVQDLGGAARVLNAMQRAVIPTPLADNLWRVRQPVRLLVGAVRRQGGIESGEIALLHDRLPDFGADTVANSGVYVHEEQPEVVVKTILALADAFRHSVAVSALTITSH
ncbi:MAG TPA: alpha/beta hydrolase [Gemmatimonadaceae bacterium]